MNEIAQSGTHNSQEHLSKLVGRKTNLGYSGMHIHLLGDRPIISSGFFAPGRSGVDDHPRHGWTIDKNAPPRFRSDPKERSPCGCVTWSSFFQSHFSGWWLGHATPSWKMWFRQLGWWATQYFCDNKIHGNQTNNQHIIFVEPVVASVAFQT